MKSSTLFFGALVLLFARPATAVEPDKAPAGLNWPAFRGQNASGIADGFPTPTAWDIPKGQNLFWKTAIPGLGHCSPIVWGDRIFVATAISGQKEPKLKVGLYGDIAPVTDESVHQWKVYCLNKQTGKIVWEQTAHSGVPKIKRHTKATHANSTLATDGSHVVALFGSEGMYCYDLKGKLLWSKDLGVLDSGYYMAPDAQWEFGSSPVIYGNKVLVQCDVQKGSFVAAFDVKDGHNIWRTPRTDVPTWGTPTVVTDGGRTQVVVNGYKHIGGYDLNTGKELWMLKGGGDIPVPTPIAANGLIYIQNAHGMMAPIYAIKTTASGDISLKQDETSNTGVAWSTKRGGGYMQTPLVVGDYYYTCQVNGILSCYEAKSGKSIYSERLGTGRTGFTSSPVAANGNIYVASEEGDVYVVKAGPEFKVAATNPLGEVCMATPAISAGKLIFRTQDHLVAIGERKTASRK